MTIERTETVTDTLAECWAPLQETVRVVLYPRLDSKRRRPLHRDLTSSEARDLARDLMEAADQAEEMDPPWEPGGYTGPPLHSYPDVTKPGASS